MAIRRFALATVSFLSLADRARAGFDWGAGCDGGSGKFSLNIDTAGTIASVGSIPAGKVSQLVS